MGIQIRWHDADQHMVIVQFEDNWTLDDFQSMVLAVRDMVQSQSYMVHVIADFMNSSTPSSAALIGIPFAVRYIQPNQGAAIVITQNEIITRLSQAAASMHKGLSQRFYVVHSRDVAERICSHFEKQKRAII